MSLGDMCRHHLIVDEGRRLRPKRKTYTAMPMGCTRACTSYISGFSRTGDTCCQKLEKRNPFHNVKALQTHTCAQVIEGGTGLQICGMFTHHHLLDCTLDAW